MLIPKFSLKPIQCEIGIVNEADFVPIIFINFIEKPLIIIIVQVIRVDFYMFLMLVIVKRLYNNMHTDLNEFIIP